MAGKMPARIPIRTLKPKAIAMAVAVMIGAFSVGEKDASIWTRPTDVASPASPPRIAMTTDSTRIWTKISPHENAENTGKYCISTIGVFSVAYTKT